MSVIDENELIEMSVDEARTAKWAYGAMKYGPDFVGNPLVKLHSEGIDALNYVDETAKQGLANEYELFDLRYHASRIVAITRAVHKKNTYSG